MGEYICLFKVLVWNEITEENVVEHGMIPVNNFAEAASYLENTLYGSELLEIQHLELFDTCPVFSEGLWNAIKAKLEDTE